MGFRLRDGITGSISTMTTDIRSSLIGLNGLVQNGALCMLDSALWGNTWPSREWHRFWRLSMAFFEIIVVLPCLFVGLLASIESGIYFIQEREE